VSARTAADSKATSSSADDAAELVNMVMAGISAQRPWWRRKEDGRDSGQDDPGMVAPGRKPTSSCSTPIRLTTSGTPENPASLSEVRQVDREKPGRDGPLPEREPTDSPLSAAGTPVAP
jgi:hypothetical protein